MHKMYQIEKSKIYSNLHCYKCLERIEIYSPCQLLRWIHGKQQQQQHLPPSAAVADSLRLGGAILKFYPGMLSAQGPQTFI